MDRAPRITVLLSVHNGEDFLGDAVQSVLDQTCRDLELLLIDDGSTDRTPTIIGSFDDKRLRASRNPERRGLTASLNIGLGLARGAYVARLDADDICLPERLERQAAFLDANPGVIVCGTWFRYHGQGENALWKAPADHEGIVSELLLRSPIQHPTAMFRREAFERLGIRYDESFAFAQDYDLWERCSRAGRLANLPEALLEYRVHGKSLSCAKRQEQDRSATRVRRRILRSLGIESPDALRTFDRIAHLRCGQEHTDLEEAHQRLLEALHGNRSHGVFPHARFSSVLYGYLFAVAERCRTQPRIPALLENSPLRAFSRVSPEREQRLAQACGAA